MAQKLAVIVSKEKLDLDSRFAWSSSLAGVDTSSAPAVVLHTSTDTEEECLACLAQIYKKDPSKKILYVNSTLSPLITTFCYGIGAAVFDQDLILSDSDILIAVMDEYTNSDFCTKPPEQEFEALRTLMNKILTGEIDEEELHATLTSPDWLKSVKASMETMDGTLVRVKDTSRELTTYVSRTYDIFADLRRQVQEAKNEMAQALQSQQDLMNAHTAESSKNTINFYPEVPVPASVRHVLYVKCCSHCLYLTNFLIGYAHHAKMVCNAPARLLVIHQKTLANQRKYENSQLFATVTSKTVDVIRTSGKNYFATAEPKKNVFDAFFDDPKTQLYIVIDDMGTDGFLLRAGRGMKTYYASGNTSCFNNPPWQEVRPQQVIRSCSGAAENMVLRTIPNFDNLNTTNARLGALHNMFATYYAGFDTALGLDN